MKAATAGLLQLCALSLSFSFFFSLFISRSISHVNHRTFHCKLRAASDIDKCIVIRRIGIDIVHLHSSPTPSPFNCCLFAYINTSRTWECVCVCVCNCITCNASLFSFGHNLQSMGNGLDFPPRATYLVAI